MKVKKTISLRADAATVWDALTNPAKTKQYFFACEAISDWKGGSKLDYQCEMDSKKLTVVTGEIRAIEPERYLEATCRGIQDGVEGHETVATYTLKVTAKGTELTATQGDFPDDSEGHAKSWDMVLGGLKTLVES